MFGLSGLAIILIVVIAVLAAKKLPELARSAGKLARTLKAEARAMNEVKEEQGTAGEQTAPARDPGRDQHTRQTAHRYTPAHHATGRRSASARPALTHAVFTHP
ncbi:twin-arginine translocase TatA/TatE family subunit [Streptomyces sp. NBC_00878]|uniref:Sec-independent protein translocase subunit TatA/TatB n=1 Tax=Streptomyces sp. NBC_00878 TaxID=2975854 RepID=UPI00225B4204|nr:twin-arginine translocase TatA/TatE family subunit [Streptomyces sp. NBC_00878]MCX4910572.1 twin-arginine translocase TatA/TatE family subunit [Streptomyces sp. NBC_00878]